MKRKFIFVSLTAGLLSMTVNAGQPTDFPLTVKDGKVTYKTDARGNRMLDFSTCGYRNSSRRIPDVANVVFIPWKAGDNSSRIQKAIDYVSSLPTDANGFRGAILLDKGEFEIDEAIRISTGGIVLRGSDKSATVIRKKGVDRGSLIYVEGIYNPTVADTLRVADAYLPVNSTEIAISGGKLNVGDRVMIIRPSTKEWIADMKCNIFGGGIDALGWKPGDIDLRWDRTVTSAANGEITIDGPLTMALDSKWGNSIVLPYSWTGRIADVGIENITLESDYDHNYSKDEDHCWNGIYIANAENCWVRKVDFRHFAGSAVVLQSTATKTTVEDCIATDHVSEIGGMRRSTFLTLGQQNLFQRCYDRNGIHAFSAGIIAPGPNAFVQCESDDALGFSGASDAWAPGLLFDVVNIDGHNLSFKNLGQDKNGAGWNTGNSMLWQCTAAEIENYSPADDALNAAYGCWAQFSGDGKWDESNNHVNPRSLFYTQLTERIGNVPETQSRIRPLATNATSSPTVEIAMQLSKEAYEPLLTLKQWISDAPFSPSVNPDGVKSIDDVKFQSKRTTVAAADSHDFAIVNGKIVMDGQVLTGGRQDVRWWSGKIKYSYLPKSSVHVTRFVPEREGLGLTDRIDSTLRFMVENNIAVLDHNYGLWYDRRRDDHERIRRRDGDVWAPFYEQPFARSGKGSAWDGLSKYDLTRPNAWYWSRLNEFAEKGATVGKLLFNQHYFQHNIIEAGAHWVDSPWRSANNINSTGFPEPVNFAGDKRIFVADMFYDVNHPTRRELHRNYIRMNLDQFADNPNVVHLISAEYTGPQHFMEFWLDVIGEWEKETGTKVKVALSATKDVQDAILSNPKYADIVDIIDIRYWHYKTDGIYAPEGGKNLAPRQHARKMKVGKITFKEAYKAVSEYRSKYPEKAVTYYAQNYPQMSWAVFMGGGSLAGIPVSDADFLTDATTMNIIDTPSDDYKILGNENGCIIYNQGSTDISINLTPGKYRLSVINPKTGEETIIKKRIKISGSYTLTPDGSTTVYRFKRI